MKNGIAECSVCHSKLVSPGSRTISRAYDDHKIRVSSKQRVLNVLLVVGDCMLVGLQVNHLGLILTNKTTLVSKIITRAAIHGFHYIYFVGTPAFDIFFIIELLLNHGGTTNGNVLSRRDELYLQNTQATMRLMGKDVSVSTSYSGRVRTGERIIAPDASIDYSPLGSHTHQSWLWRRTTLEVSENHSTTTLGKNWNKALLRDTSKDPFPLFYEPRVSLASQFRTDVVPDSKFPSTILNPCCSLASFPLSDKDLNFHGYNFTCSHQQPPFPSNYDDVDIGLQPDARKPSFGFPFSCTDSTIRSQPPWPQSSSFESHGSGMSFINPLEQQVSCYGSKSSSYINVGTTNKLVASVDEYPMKNHKIPKLPMQGGLYSAKEFFAGQ